MIITFQFCFARICSLMWQLDTILYITFQIVLFNIFTFQEIIFSDTFTFHEERYYIDICYVNGSRNDSIFSERNSLIIPLYLLKFPPLPNNRRSRSRSHPWGVLTSNLFNIYAHKKVILKAHWNSNLFIGWKQEGDLWNTVAESCSTLVSMITFTLKHHTKTLFLATYLSVLHCKVID